MDARELCIRPVNISIPKKALFFILKKGSIPASQQVPVMGVIYPSPNALCTFKERLFIIINERMWYFRGLFSMATCLGLKYSQICSHDN